MFWKKKTPFQKALAAGLAPRAELGKALLQLRGYSIETADDARAVCAALRQVQPGEDGALSPWRTLLGLLRQVGSKEAAAVFRAEATPMLVEQVATSLAEQAPGSKSVLIALETLAYTRTGGGGID
jgi:hypothetical protein